MICSKCHKDQNKNQFYIGKSWRCKTCWKDYQRQYKAENRDRVYAVQKKWREKNKEYLSAYYKEWYRKNGRKRNKKAAVATQLLNNAVARKEIERPGYCEVCNHKNAKINGHHKDYSEPLIVIWVCHSCHGKIHSGGILAVTDKP